MGVKRIGALTKEQEAAMPAYVEKWIDIGLRTGDADFEIFDKYMPVAYEKAGLEYPKNVVRVQSPLVGALAASIAEQYWRSKGAVHGAVSDAVDGAVDDAVHGAVHGAVSDAVGDAVDGAVRDAVDGAVHGAVGGAVHGAVGGAVRDAVRGAVDGAVGDAVHGAVDGAVGDAVDGAVRGAVDGAVGGAVRDAVGDAVDGAVRGAVDDAVGDAVDGAVGDAVDGAVRGAVDGAVHGAKLEWHYWLGGQFWVGGWYWGCAYVNYFFDVCDLELDKDIMERVNAYRKICESVNYIWPNKNFVIVCDRPKHINRNTQGQLHSDREKSIEYKDGWGLYHLHGVQFDEELWTKVVSRKMPFADILKIEDIDQRKQAMKYANVWEFVSYAKGVELDTHTKIGSDGREIRYWLYRFAAGEVFDREVTYAIYDDSMLGAAAQHMQGVPNDCNTVAEAFAWKQSDDLYQVTPQEWLELELDVDFT